MCNSDVSLPCTGGSEPCPTSDAAEEEVRSTPLVRKGGNRLKRQNGRMIRAQRTVEENRVCGKGRKRKVTWYHRLLGYRLVTALWWLFHSIWSRCCYISLQQLNSTLLLLFSLRSRVGGAERWYHSCVRGLTPDLKRGGSFQPTHNYKT